MNGYAISLPQWYLDYRESWKQVSYEEYGLDSWQTAYDELFGEADEGDSFSPRRLPIAFPIEDRAKRKTFETILKNNSCGLALDTTIFHYTTSAYLNEAVKRGGFILSQPKDWSVQWEDSVFKNRLKELQRKSKEPTIPSLLANSYMRDSYGMCWTLNDDNPCIAAMFKRKHASESIVVISSTVKQLLSAYMTDNLSVRSCFLIKMRYCSEKKLRESVVDPEDLFIGDFGTDVHHNSIAVTANKFVDQNEVRLIVEDSQSLSDKTIIQIRNQSSGHTETKLVKHVDFASIINSVRVFPNEYLFGISGQKATK